ncbi:unnamed protein product [Lactuca saligna]|uniref:Uncharacterized protein n=1 Tax=Lactuca saligna TaxID=75948 RepID=A0AA35ZPX4_LACSI|nr:unnamed protein product [Lactuca saligna]
MAARNPSVVKSKTVKVGPVGNPIPTISDQPSVTVSDHILQPLKRPLAGYVCVSHDISTKPYGITGILINKIHFFSRKILLVIYTGTTSKKAPIRNNHTRVLYNPVDPKSRPLMSPLQLASDLIKTSSTRITYRPRNKAIWVRCRHFHAQCFGRRIGTSGGWDPD